MRLDGPTLAHAWLAVFAAASTDKNSPYYKSIAIEEHITGVRLVATDRLMLLTSWVSDLEHHYDSGPELDVAPERVIVSNDADARGRGLMGYVCSLANRYNPEDYAPGTIELALTFDERLPPGSQGPQEALEGLEATYTVLSVPDRERVYLEIVGSSYPDPREVLARHKSGRTSSVLLDPETVERLAKIRKHAAGPLAWSFGAKEGLALVDYPESDPYVHGAVMPRKDDTEQAADVDHVEDPAQTTIDDELGTDTEAGPHRFIPSGDGDSPHDRSCVECGGFEDEEGVEHVTLAQFAEAAYGVDAVSEPELLDAVEALTAARSVTATPEATETERDLESAVRYVVSTQFGSAKMLVRKMGVTKAHSAVIMSALEAHGIVGPVNGPKARDVLITPDRLDEAIRSVTGR